MHYGRFRGYKSHQIAIWKFHTCSLKLLSCIPKYHSTSKYLNVCEQVEATDVNKDGPVPSSAALYIVKKKKKKKIKNMISQVLYK